jgi:hypothetical protein
MAACEKCGKAKAATVQTEHNRKPKTAKSEIDRIRKARKLNDTRTQSPKRSVGVRAK